MITDGIMDNIKDISDYISIKGYDQTIDSYGLIHTDLHFGNMYYDGQTLTIFDWDDACYKHFISDIAIILFYTFTVERLRLCNGFA